MANARSFLNAMASNLPNLMQLYLVSEQLNLQKQQEMRIERVAQEQMLTSQQARKQGEELHPLQMKATEANIFAEGQRAEREGAYSTLLSANTKSINDELEARVQLRTMSEDATQYLRQYMTTKEITPTQRTELKTWLDTKVGEIAILRGDTDFVTDLGKREPLPLQFVLSSMSFLMGMEDQSVKDEGAQMLEGDASMEEIAAFLVRKGVIPPEAGDAVLDTNSKIEQALRAAFDAEAEKIDLKLPRKHRNWLDADGKYHEKTLKDDEFQDAMAEHERLSDEVWGLLAQHGIITDEFASGLFEPYTPMYAAFILPHLSPSAQYQYQTEHPMGAIRPSGMQAPQAGEAATRAAQLYKR